MAKRKQQIKKTERIKAEVRDILTRMIAAEIRHSRKAKQHV